MMDFTVRGEYNRATDKEGTNMAILPYQQIASKALKTAVLRKSERIRPYLPVTEWYDPSALFLMLNRFRSVFIKPDKGGGGAGVIRLTLRQDGDIEAKTLYTQNRLGREELIKWVERRFKPQKRYIMQQGITLAQVKGRPFDIRVHLQKPVEKWKVIGFCAKLAAPGKIVTNYCRGGKPYDAYQALVEAAGGNVWRAREVYQELYFLSKEIANTLNSRFIGLKELGIDAGVDQALKVWIFEVNTRPCFKMFRYLSNPIPYRTIKKIHHYIVC
jgi:YheC/D like ATP-grasp